MSKTILSTENIESFLGVARGFVHWEQSSLEDIDMHEDDNILQFSPAHPVEGFVIKEKLSLVSECFHSFSPGNNTQLPETPKLINPCLEEKLKSLKENYFEYTSLVDFLLPKLPLEFRLWSFEGNPSKKFKVTDSNEKHRQGTLLLRHSSSSLNSSDVSWPQDLYSAFLNIQRCRFNGLNPFPPFDIDAFKRDFYPNVYFFPTDDDAVIRYALASKHDISSYVIEIQCLSRLEGPEWSDSFSRIVFGLIFSDGDMKRVCDLIADQLAEPRNIKFLQMQTSTWRDDVKAKHLPFKLVRILCALSKLSGSSQLASIVPGISRHLSVPLGVLEKSMLLHAGNYDLFQELKGVALSYVLNPPHDNFTAEDQAVCFVFESLMYSNPKSGRQVLADVLAYLEEKDVHKNLKRVASALVN